LNQILPTGSWRRRGKSWEMEHQPTVIGPWSQIPRMGPFNNRRQTGTRSSSSSPRFFADNFAWHWKPWRFDVLVSQEWRRRNETYSGQQQHRWKRSILGGFGMPAAVGDFFLFQQRLISSTMTFPYFHHHITTTQKSNNWDFMCAGMMGMSLQQPPNLNSLIKHSSRNLYRERCKVQEGTNSGWTSFSSKQKITVELRTPSSVLLKRWMGWDGILYPPLSYTPTSNAIPLFCTQLEFSREIKCDSPTKFKVSLLVFLPSKP